VSLSKPLFCTRGIGVIASNLFFIFESAVWGERVKPRGYPKIPVGIMFLTAYPVKPVYLKAKLCHRAATRMHYSLNPKRFA